MFVSIGTAGSRRQNDASAADVYGPTPLSARHSSRYFGTPCATTCFAMSRNIKPRRLYPRPAHA